MFRQLKFRDRLTILGVAPLVVIAVVATGLLLFLGTDEARPYGLFAAGGLVVAGAIAFLAGRSILLSVNQLTDATAALAAAHRRLAAGEIVADELEPIETGKADHIGRLVASINSINAATVEISDTQRGAVKAGLSNIVVNLARRSQTLLDRQVEYLDRLESSEEDPDRLGELFKVDHLATRMRRNAESLLVLAEADPGRRRGGPVDIGDVLRVAMGEVEIYQNIELSRIDQGQISATTAVDLAHLTAELMENATQFSPPNTPVEVSGEFTASNKFVISIADQGIGLGEEKLKQTNELLANPPELGLGMGRSLGFVVIGRLAQRLKATVTLEPNGDVGSKAVVTIPADLFLSRGSGLDGHAQASEPAPVSAPAPTPVPTAEAINSTPPPLPAHERAAASQPAGATANGSTVAADAAPGLDVPGPDSSAVDSPGIDNPGIEGPAIDIPVVGIPNGGLPTFEVASPEAAAEAATPDPVDQTPAALAEQPTTEPAEPPASNPSPTGSSALERLLGFNPAVADRPAPAADEEPMDWASTSPFGGDTPDNFGPDADITQPHLEGDSTPPPPAAPAVPSVEADIAQPFVGDTFTTPAFDAGLPPVVDPPGVDSPALDSPALDSPALDSLRSAPDHHEVPAADAPGYNAPAAETSEFDTPFGVDPQLNTAADGAEQSPWGGWDQSTDPALPPTQPNNAEAGDADHWAAPQEQVPNRLTPIEPTEPEPFTYTEPKSGAGSWTPPEVTPGPPSKLEQALPSGDAFETGVASLLNDSGHNTLSEPNSAGGVEQPGDQGARPALGDDATSAGLAKRQRGASHVPIGEGRPVASSKRDPEEVRSRLTRYREGLKGRRPTTPNGSEPEQTDTRDR